MSRDEQLSKERDQPESRQESAKNVGGSDRKETKTEADRPSTEEEKSRAELLKSSGGDPLTQEG